MNYWWRAVQVCWHSIRSDVQPVVLGGKHRVCVAVKVTWPVRNKFKLAKTCLKLSERTNCWARCVSCDLRRNSWVDEGSGHPAVCRCVCVSVCRSLMDYSCSCLHERSHLKALKRRLLLLLLRSFLSENKSSVSCWLKCMLCVCVCVGISSQAFSVPRGHWVVCFFWPPCLFFLRCRVCNSDWWAHLHQFLKDIIQIIKSFSELWQHFAGPPYITLTYLISGGFSPWCVWQLKPLSPDHHEHQSS